MPRINFNDKKLNKYHIHFFSYDCIEKMHVHITDKNENAKVWVDYNQETRKTNLTVHSNTFSDKEINSITKALKKYGSTIKKSWDEHCRDIKQPLR